MGLKRIVLRDFVIVDALDLELEKGFTVLTGETGAGKSILIDALQLVTGARADVGLIREGASRTEVSAEFDPAEGLAGYLVEAGFDAGESLLLRRSVDLGGKSRAWVNGSPATAQQLRHIGEHLLDIHGQHAWQSLTRNEAVRGLLDGYGRVQTSALSGLWLHWRQAQAAMAHALEAQSALQQERERLAWQIGEVEKLNPGAEEWDTLNASHSRLAHGQTLLDAAQSALEQLADADESALQRLHSALQQLQNQLHLDPEFQEPADVLSSAIAQIEDAAHTLRSYQRRTEPDPERLAELDARLALWVSLARRYKRAPGELAEALSGWQSELAQLDAAADLAGLQRAADTAHAAFMQEGQRVSKARAQAAPQLAQAITQAMQGLGMQGGQFVVQLDALAQPQQSGLEEVVFLVAGHAGSTPRPVAKVASGGELSRMALAIAVTTSQLGTAQTLIFDEVDAGVGGTVAHTVGQLMQQLGRDRQVLAVTHLPQVAACADQHWVVAKQLHEGATVSRVAEVQGDARTAEIARMLGGDGRSATTSAHASEMLQRGMA
ncbi:MAG: DNA repair protein RecN [Rhodoferax sp.]|nr:DNA repair protein RecN [Rhodoferax sp.]